MAIQGRPGIAEAILQPFGDVAGKLVEQQMGRRQQGKLFQQQQQQKQQQFEQTQSMFQELLDSEDYQKLPIEDKMTLTAALFGGPTAQAGIAARKAEQPEPEKPGIKETAELKDLGDTAGKIDQRLVDLKRAREIVPQTTTGPFLGRVAESTILSKNQQELKGIASRLLTGSFTVLPRILSEFESFKSGQVSLQNPPETNLRLINNMEKAALLEKSIIDRIDELQRQGRTELSAFRQAKGEFKGQAENLLKDFKSDAAQGNTQSASPEEIDAIMFGG